MIELKHSGTLSVLLVICPAMIQYAWLLRASVQLLPDLLEAGVANAPTLSLMIGLSPLCAIGLQICAQELVARFGSPQLLCVGQLVAGLGSLLMSVQFPTAWVLLVGRGLQSIGVGLISVAVQRAGFLLAKPSEIQKILAGISIMRSLLAFLSHVATGISLELGWWEWEIVSLGALGVICTIILFCSVPMRFVPRGFAEKTWVGWAVSTVLFNALIGGGLICLFERFYVVGGCLCGGAIVCLIVHIIAYGKMMARRRDSFDIPMIDSSAGTTQRAKPISTRVPLTAKHLFCALFSSQVSMGIDFCTVPIVLRLLLKTPHWVAGILLAATPFVEMIGSPLITSVTKRKTAAKSSAIFSCINFVASIASIVAAITLQHYPTAMTYVWICALTIERLGVLGNLVTLQSGQFAALSGSFTPRRTAMNQTSRDMGMFFGCLIAGGVFGMVGTSWAAIYILLGIKIATGIVLAVAGSLRVKHGRFEAQ